MTVDRVEESLHRRPPDVDIWTQRWAFDLADPTSAVTGLLAVDTLEEADGTYRVGYSAAVDVPGVGVVAVLEPEVPAPPSWRNLELRGPGLWACHTCETPGEHWSVGLEAAALILDDDRPGRVAALAGLPGALGFDLEWYGLTPPEPLTTDGPAGGGYRQSCRVIGDVLLPDRTVSLEATGARLHVWGEPTGPAWGAPPSVPEGSRRTATGSPQVGESGAPLPVLAADGRGLEWWPISRGARR